MTTVFVFDQFLTSRIVKVVNFFHFSILRCFHKRMLTVSGPRNLSRDRFLAQNLDRFSLETNFRQESRTKLKDGKQVLG